MAVFVGSTSPSAVYGRTQSEFFHDRDVLLSTAIRLDDESGVRVA